MYGAKGKIFTNNKSIFVHNFITTHDAKSASHSETTPLLHVIYFKGDLFDMYLLLISVQCDYRSKDITHIDIRN